MTTCQHFILTLGRSGSNALVDMINQNPALLNYGEVLGTWTPIRKAQRRLGLLQNDDDAYLDAVLGNNRVIFAANLARTLGKLRNGRIAEIKRIRRLHSVGVKDFSLNMIRCGLNDYLYERKQVRVIGLIRANPLGRMISALRLQNTGEVSRRKGKGANEERGRDRYRSRSL